jgi:cytochrome c556
MGQGKFVAIGIFAFLSLFVTSQLFAQQDVIEKRQKLMKSNNAASKELKAAVAKGDYATVQAKAKTIEQNATMLADLFPKGSTSEKSRAKPEIWKKWDEFGKKLTALKDAATALARTARTKNEMEVGAKFKAFGSTCKDCHESFRAPKKK